MEEAAYMRKAAFQGETFISHRIKPSRPREEKWELLVGFSREGSHPNVTKEHSREAVL